MADEAPVKKTKMDAHSIGMERIKAGDEEVEEEMGVLDNIALFQQLPTELGIESMDMVEYRPANTIIDGSVIEINVPCQGLTYYDLSKSLLYVRARIAHNDGTAVKAGEKVTWINIPMHSLFRQMELTLQNTIITNGVNNNYPYKAILDVLTSFDEDVKETMLQSVLYSKDTRNAIDNDDPTDPTNLGLRWRYSLTDGGKAVDMLGPLYLDICSQERLLLNNVKLTLRLFPSLNAFALTSPEQGKYKTVIEDVIFKLASVRVSSKVIVGHDEGLKHSPAMYYLKRSEIKAYSIPRNSAIWAVDDLFCSKIPSKLIVTFVETDAYLGNEKKSPFNFQNFNLSFLNLEINGISHPKYPFKPDYDEKRYIESYLSLFSGNGTVNTNASNYIERLDFAGGYGIYVIPIDPYRSDDWINPTKFGCTRLNVRFKESLKVGVTMLCYGIFDDILQIDRNRNVQFKAQATTAIGGGLALLRGG